MRFSAAACLLLIIWPTVALAQSIGPAAEVADLQSLRGYAPSGGNSVVIVDARSSKDPGGEASLCSPPARAIRATTMTV